MQADPYLAPEALKNPQAWNRYAYVAGDPVNYYDPAGLDACSGNYGVPCFSITVVRFLYFLWLRSFGGGGRRFVGPARSRGRGADRASGARA
jgi:hypothetical protein